MFNDSPQICFSFNRVGKKKIIKQDYLFELAVKDIFNGVFLIKWHTYFFIPFLHFFNMPECMLTLLFSSLIASFNLLTTKITARIKKTGITKTKSACIFFLFYLSSHGSAIVIVYQLVWVPERELPFTVISNGVRNL